MPANETETAIGPEYLQIFVGYSSDGKTQAETIVGLEPQLQGELDKIRRLNRNVPFIRVKCFMWENDAPTHAGGQSEHIDPVILRANIAVFVFNERVGRVSWEELELARTRIPPIPVLPFFPSKPPPDERMNKAEIAQSWFDLCVKRDSLAANWTEPGTKALTPLPNYSDLKSLANIASEKLNAAILRLAIASADPGDDRPLPPVSPSHKSSSKGFPIGKKMEGEGARAKLVEVTSSAGSIVSVAPPGTGRYSATVVPTLNATAGMALVLDPTGQIYQSTVESREVMGDVIKLDPWGLVPDKRSGSLNPVDIANGLGMSANDGARFLADMLVPYHVYEARRKDRMTRDPFWPNMERKLMVGLLLLAMSEAENKSTGVFARMRDILNGDDQVYNLAVALDKHNAAKKAHSATKATDEAFKGMDPEAYTELASFLQLPDVTRGGVIAGANQHLGAFGSSAVRRLTESSSFDVGKWIRGEPITIYLIGPVAGVAAFDSVYRLWFGALLAPLLLRPVTSDRPALVVIDVNEVFDVWPGVAAAITQAATCRIWTIVSDLAEIDAAFGGLAASVINSFAAIQAFRPKNYVAAERLSLMFNVPAEKIMEVSATELWAMVDGMQAVRLTRLDQ